MLHARFNSAAAACLSPALIVEPFFTLIFRDFSVPTPSKLAIPAAASIQISLSNLAAVGSPLYDPPPPPPSSLALAAWPIVRHQVFRSYVGFKRDASHTAQPPMGVWELDGWWRSPEQASSDAGSIKATVAIIIVCSCVVAAVIYRCVSILFFHFHRHLLKATHFDLSFSHHVTTPARSCFFGSTGRERRAQLKMTTARMVRPPHVFFLRSSHPLSLAQPFREESAQAR